MSSGNWKGYTIEDIRYQKALALLKIEMQKERLAAIKDDAMASVSQNRWGKVISSVSSYKNVFAYMITGYKLYKAVSKLRNRLSRKK